MSLFSEKNYASIVSPLNKIKTELTHYMKEQQEKIANLELQKLQVETDIATSEMEIKKSNATSTKISDLLSLDLDEDGVPDIEQLPLTSTSTDTSDTSK